MKNAVWLRYRGVVAKVLTAEYLVAISLQTGRARDRERAIRLLEEAVVDRTGLARIVGAFGLTESSGSWRSDSMKNDAAEIIFRRKVKRRRLLARLPFEKKIEIVVELQRTAAEIRKDPRRIVWPL